MLAVGGEYLKIVAWNFIPSGLVFVSSSMFQALGNTIPSLVSSLIRTALLVIPAYLMSRVNGFALHWIWYLSVVGRRDPRDDEPAAPAARVPAEADVRRAGRGGGRIGAAPRGGGVAEPTRLAARAAEGRGPERLAARERHFPR